MDLAPAISIALEAIPPDERGVGAERAVQRHVESSAVRLLSLARSMLAGRQLPRECVALVFTAVAEDLLSGPPTAPRRPKVRSRKDLDRPAHLQTSANAGLRASCR